MTNEILITADNGNATLQVSDALKGFNENADNCLIFEKGVYRFYREGCYFGFFAPSNNDPGDKHVVFPIIDKHNLTIDGNGSQFIFCDRVLPFVIQNSSNIVLKNFSIDFSFQRYCQARVESCDEEGLTIYVDQNDSPYKVKDNHVLFHCGSDIISTEKSPLFVTDMSDPFVPRAYLFTCEREDNQCNMPAKAQFTAAAQNGDNIIFRYHKDSPRVKYSKGDILVCNNDGRQNGLFFAENSKEIIFENIAAYRGAGMGLIAQMCENITVDGLSVMPNPKREDRASITADILHFVFCTGKLIVRNSKLVGAMDDALNVHGNYTLLDKIVSKNTIHLHSWHPGTVPFRKGDRAVFIAPESGLAVAEIETESTVLDADGNLNVVFKDDISDNVVEGMWVESPDRMPEFLFENNYVFDCPTIRVSTSKPAVIRNNEINTNTHGIYISNEMKYWHESGPVNDIVIQDNIFGDRCGGSSITLHSETIGNGKRLHGHIKILNNRFKLPEERAVSADCVKELTVKDNIYGD